MVQDIMRVLEATSKNRSKQKEKWGKFFLEKIRILKERLNLKDQRITSLRETNIDAMNDREMTSRQINQELDTIFSKFWEKTYLTVISPVKLELIKKWKELGLAGKTPKLPAKLLNWKPKSKKVKTSFTEERDKIYTRYMKRVDYLRNLTKNTSAWKSMWGNIEKPKMVKELHKLERKWGVSPKKIDLRWMKGAENSDTARQAYQGKSDEAIIQDIKRNYPLESAQETYSRFVAAKGLKPGIDAKDFIKKYNIFEVSGVKAQVDLLKKLISIKSPGYSFKVTTHLSRMKFKGKFPSISISVGWSRLTDVLVSGEALFMLTNHGLLSGMTAIGTDRKFKDMFVNDIREAAKEINTYIALSL